MKVAPFAWAEIKAQIPESQIGSEHFVEQAESRHRIAKVTIPPDFGRTPAVRSHQAVNLRGEPGIREEIEFVPATPLEYLERWLLANEVFGDDARLASVIEWPDGELSFGITQPQYHGVPAEQRDIELYFRAAGWTRLKDPSGHLVFYNYAFQVIAIDAAGRNCYLTNEISSRSM